MTVPLQSITAYSLQPDIRRIVVNAIEKIVTSARSNNYIYMGVIFFIKIELLLQIIIIVIIIILKINLYEL